MFNVLKSLRRDEDGAAMIEYGLMILLVALVALAAVQMLGNSVQAFFTNAATSL